MTRMFRASVWSAASVNANALNVRVRGIRRRPADLFVCCSTSALWLSILTHPCGGAGDGASQDGLIQKDEFMMALFNTRSDKNLFANRVRWWGGAWRCSCCLSNCPSRLGWM
jgi:hypothetical protein